MKPEEIAAVLASQKLNDDYALDLGNGLIARLTATTCKNPEHPSFILERNGIDKGNIKNADEATLAELSDIITAKFGVPFVYPNTVEDDLMPDALKEPSPDQAKGLDAFVPDALREKPDPLEGMIGALTPDDLRPKENDPNLEPDPTELVPDWAREKKAPAKPTIEDDLTPNRLRTED